MGFTSWPYAPSEEATNNTYTFLSDNADIYSEHIDSYIPWNSWMRDSALPEQFVNEISAKAARKLPNAKLTVSVSLLNSARNELASDLDGSVPEYSSFNDTRIEEAYFKHLKYIAANLNPDYLLVAIEVNELLKNAPNKWNGYKQLMSSIRTRMKGEFPNIKISESITLHNYYNIDVEDPNEFINEITTYANTLDFVAISFYPFFKGLKTTLEFQDAFDFLHEKITKPIVIAETGHLSEDLSVESFNLYIPGSQGEQNEYLQTLLINAQEYNYEYIIWWTHRDYTLLWETFPEEAKDLGKLWLSTGLINEDGTEKEAYKSWGEVFEK